MNRTISTTRLDKDAFGAISTDNATTFDVFIQFPYVYRARSTLGFDVINVSDPSNIVQEFSALTKNNTSGHGCRGAYVLGTDLFLLIRNGDDITGTGRIEKWDITNPILPVWSDDFWENTDGDLYSAFCYSEVTGKFYVSGQKSGIWEFDPTDLNQGPTDSNITGSWETQGNATDGLYTYYMNYGFGVRILDNATNGLVTDIVVPVLSVNTVSLRPWQAIIKGNRLYISTNTANTTTPTRGLLVIDISDPANIPASTAAYESFTAMNYQDAATWNTAGDQPVLGIAELDEIVYIANGEIGIGAWDIRIPGNPVYLDQIGVPDSPDQLFTVGAYKSGGISYLIYGDGQEPTGIGTKQFYIDELTIEAQTMFTIGLETPATTLTKFISNVTARSAGIGTGRQYKAAAGDIIQEVGLTYDEAVGVRDWTIGLYTADGAGKPDILVTILASGTTSAGGADGVKDSFSVADFPLDDEIDYTLAIIMTSISGLSVLSDDSVSGYEISIDSTVSTGVLNPTWFDSGNAAEDLAIYAKGINIPPSGSPTLTTPYPDLTFLSGQSVNIDLNPNISGDTSLVVDVTPGLQGGLSESSGIISGTAVIPTGTATVTVTGINSFGSVRDRFQLTTLTTGSPTSGINVPINEA